MQSQKKVISSAAEWEGKYEAAELALSQITGVKSATILRGNDSKPVDRIDILSNHTKHPKRIVSSVETVLKNLFNLVIDYRVISIE